jgi:5'-nucleotidase
VIKVNGKAILDALENSVSSYPALEGRFPQVSNIEFEFDPSNPPNSRVAYVKIGDAPLDLEKVYVLVTRGYMARGKDGFDSLLVKSEGGQAEEIVSEENGILISMMLRQYFLSLKILGKWKMWGKGMARHWKGVHETLHEAHPVVESRAEGNSSSMREIGGESSHIESDDESIAEVPKEIRESTEQREREIHLIKKVTRKWRRLAGLSGQPNCCDNLTAGEFKVDWTKVSGIRHNLLLDSKELADICRPLHRDWKDVSESPQVRKVASKSSLLNKRVYWLTHRNTLFARYSLVTNRLPFSNS